MHILEPSWLVLSWMLLFTKVLSNDVLGEWDFAELASFDDYLFLIYPSWLKPYILIRPDSPLPNSSLNFLVLYWKLLYSSFDSSFRVSMPWDPVVSLEASLFRVFIYFFVSTYVKYRSGYAFFTLRPILLVVSRTRSRSLLLERVFLPDEFSPLYLKLCSF